MLKSSLGGWGGGLAEKGWSRRAEAEPGSDPRDMEMEQRPGSLGVGRRERRHSPPLLQHPWSCLDHRGGAVGRAPDAALGSLSKPRDGVTLRHRNRPARVKSHQPGQGYGVLRTLGGFASGSGRPVTGGCGDGREGTASRGGGQHLPAWGSRPRAGAGVK